MYMYIILAIRLGMDWNALRTLHQLAQQNASDIEWFQRLARPPGEQLQRTGTSNTKLLDAELVFLGRLVDDPRLRLVLPEVAEAVVLEEVGQQVVEVTVRAEEIVIQVGVQLSTFVPDLIIITKKLH